MNLNYIFYSAFIITLMVLSFFMIDSNFGFCLFFLGLLGFIIGASIVRNLSWKTIIWFFVIYFISLLPVIIEKLKTGVTFNDAIINSYENNSFYSVLFSIMAAGYVDFCFSKTNKILWLHCLTLGFLFFTISIGRFEILPESITWKLYFYYLYIYYVCLITIMLKHISELK